MEKSPVRKWIGRIFVALVACLVLGFIVVFVLLPSLFRDQYYAYYTSRLDAWVANGGDVKSVDQEVVWNCGKLVTSQAGRFELLQLETFYRDEFSFRVDVCAKMTVNRVYKQPEFEKPEVVSMICDDPHPYHELFGRLCRRSGLRAALSGYVR